MNIQNQTKTNSKPNGAPVGAASPIVTALMAEATKGELSLDIMAMMQRGIPAETAAGLFQVNIMAQANFQIAQAKASQRPEQELYVKVSSKGAISVYGFGKWPITLYREQWKRLLSHGNDLSATIDLVCEQFPQHIATKGQDMPDHIGSDGKPTARTAAIKLIKAS